MSGGRKGVTPRSSTGMPVEVDPSFVRLFADQALVMNLGRDIDLALLAVGPKLLRVQRGKDDHDVMRMHPQLNEVARVRITPAGAAAMAIEILQAQIKSNFIIKSELMAILEAAEPEVAYDEEPADVDDADFGEAGHEE